MGEFIRIWKDVDMADISGHLLIVGVLTGDCGSCKELGINYATAKACPNCGIEFKYIASRNKEIKKIKRKRPDLIFIDIEDYNRVKGLSKAKNLFGLGDE